jgi:hypothetical protein
VEDKQMITLMEVTAKRGDTENIGPLLENLSEDDGYSLVQGENVLHTLELLGMFELAEEFSSLIIKIHEGDITEAYGFLSYCPKLSDNAYRIIL